MSKKKPKVFNPKHHIEAINKWRLPFYDKKHNYYIYLNERARSNQTRINHIIDYSHNLKARDLQLVPGGINDYFEYKKDPVYKNTFNYYIKRGGKDKGMIKVSIRIDDNNAEKAWIKTIFITYNLK